LLPGGKQCNFCHDKETVRNIMNTWIKPEFEEIGLAMEVTAYVNVGK
jgi:coenzyme PQQ precursor peptide PqqA